MSEAVAAVAEHFHLGTAVYQWQSQKHRFWEGLMHNIGIPVNLRGGARLKRGVSGEKPSVATYLYFSLSFKFHLYVYFQRIRKSESQTSRENMSLQ